MAYLSRLSNRIGRKCRTLASQSVNAQRKIIWRLKAGTSGDTIPIFIFGAQRSGTTMLGECLGKSPEMENLGESDPRAFLDYSLRDIETVKRLIDKCPYPRMIFKPLKDSHRVSELLGLHSGAKAIWAYRHYMDRINSAVRSFGRHPLDVFSKFNQDETISWQLRGLSKSDEELVKQLDVDRLTVNDGAALMWYVRNALYFNQALEHDSRVLLWSYDEFVANPAPSLGALTAFLGVNCYPYMVGGIHNRSVGKNPHPDIDPRINALCAQLHERLDMVRRRCASK